MPAVLDSRTSRKGEMKVVWRVIYRGVESDFGMSASKRDTNLTEELPATQSVFLKGPVGTGQSENYCYSSPILLALNSPA